MKTIAQIAWEEDAKAWRRFQRRRRLPQFAAGYFAGLASAAVLLAAVVWG